MRAKSSASRLAPPDQGAVDVGLGHQLGGVGRLHRAAVLDAHGVGRRRRRRLAPRPPADERAHGLGVLGAWRCGPVPMAQIGS